MKRYIDKFLINKKVPNETFFLSLPAGDRIAMTLSETVERIYAEGKGNEVKKTLKATFARNLEMDKVLAIFESLAFQFLLNDYGKEFSGKVKKILEESIRRRDNLFINVESECGELECYEILFQSKNEQEPFILVNNAIRESRARYSKKAFIEKLLSVETSIKNII